MFIPKTAFTVYHFLTLSPVAFSVLILGTRGFEARKPLLMPGRWLWFILVVLLSNLPVAVTGTEVVSHVGLFAVAVAIVCLFPLRGFIVLGLPEDDIEAEFQSAARTSGQPTEGIEIARLSLWGMGRFRATTWDAQVALDRIMRPLDKAMQKRRKSLEMAPFRGLVLLGLVVFVLEVALLMRI